MPTTRDAARSLVAQKQIRVLQKGRELGVNEEYRGPIRLQLCRCEGKSELQVDVH